MKPALIASAVAVAAAMLAGLALRREARRTSELEKRIAALEAEPAARPAPEPAPRPRDDARPIEAPAGAPDKPSKAAPDPRVEKLEARIAQLEARVTELSRAQRVAVAEEVAGLDATQLWEKVQLAFADENSERAYALIGEFLKRFPNDPKVPEALMALGKSEIVVADWAGAMEVYGKLVAEHPESKEVPYAQFYLGMGHVAQGDMVAGREQYEKAFEGLKGNPYWQAAALINLGEAYAERGETELAKEYLRRLTTQFAGNEQAGALVKQAAAKLKELESR